MNFFKNIKLIKEESKKIDLKNSDISKRIKEDSEKLSKEIELFNDKWDFIHKK